MSLRLIRKLEQFTRLSGEDKRALEQVALLRRRQLEPHDDLVREGDRPRHVNLILDGWACRYKMLEDGRRAITAFLIPGDVCDMRIFVLKQMDHSIAALSSLTVAEVPADAVLDLTDTSPRLSRAFWWTSLVEEATAREWTANLGQRDALESMAHLFCELFIRLQGVGLTQGRGYDFPVTQEQLADALGLSTVHVNRTLQALRERRLVELRGKTLTIPDLEALKAAALFNDNYLHLDHEGRDLDANETAG